MTKANEAIIEAIIDHREEVLCACTIDPPNKFTPILAAFDLVLSYLVLSYLGYDPNDSGAPNLDFGEGGE